MSGIDLISDICGTSHECPCHRWGDPDNDDDNHSDDDNLFGILPDELSDDGCGGIDRGG